MGMPVGDPEPCSGRFSQTLLHQDLGTSLTYKSLNLGKSETSGLKQGWLRQDAKKKGNTADLGPRILRL
jgi:hypothetical protein